MRTDSRRQLAVYHAWDTTDYNLMIQAVAGGSKTTTLMGILQRCQYRTLFLAFNKAIQEEISHKIEQAGYGHAKAMTLHSLGLSAIKNVHSNYSLVKGKNWQMIKSLHEYNRGLFTSMSWEDKSKTNITLMEMNDVSRIYLTNEVTEILAYMTEMDRYFYIHPQLDALWEEFLQIREEFDQRYIIDYLDMIYLVVKNNLVIPIQPYYLMIDEAQDLSYVQHKMVDQLIAQGDVHKWVAVGDRRQAIYGFSGSHANSFDLFKSKGNVYELPLDVCYRCPQAIIREANKVYDVMEPFKEYDGIVDTVTEIGLIQNGAMIICRNTSPLINLYFQLLGEGRQPILKGEDILNSLQKFLDPYKYKTVSQTIYSINVDISEINDKQRKTDDERFKLYRLQDNLTNLKLLQKHFCNSSDKISVILDRLKTMFETQVSDGVITLCTIHKAKGLEADVVYILNEHLIPSKFAKSDSQLQQERNLKYVARTRAKEEMYYLNLTIN